MEPIEIIINHDPVPWSAPRIGRHGTCYNKHYRLQEPIRWLIATEYTLPPIQSYVHLDFTFYFPYPQSASKKKVELMRQGKIYPTRSDLTNLQKFAEDCLKKIVIEDDRNVVQITSKKLYALNGCIKIKITPCEP